MNPPLRQKARASPSRLFLFEGGGRAKFPIPHISCAELCCKHTEGLTTTRVASHHTWCSTYPSHPKHTTVCYSCHALYIAADIVKLDTRGRDDSRATEAAAAAAAAGFLNTGRPCPLPVDTEGPSHPDTVVMDDHHRYDDNPSRPYLKVRFAEETTYSISVMFDLENDKPRPNPNRNFNRQ